MYKKKILITDKTDISNYNYDKIYVFNKLKVNQDYSKNSNIIFLSKELDNNSEYFKKKYLNFISKISAEIQLNKLNINKNFNLYISSLFFEKSPFKTNVFLQIQLIVLKEKLFNNKNLKVDYQFEHNSLQISSQRLVAKMFKHKLNT